MQFDDRLATVLRMRAPGAALARIQYRQLIDLLGTQPSEARGEAIDAAFDRLGELGAEMPAAERLAVLKDAATRLRSPRLVAMLASDDPAVAKAAIDNARLAVAEWTDLLPALPAAARARLASRADLDPALVERLARSGVSRLSLPPVEAAAEDLASVPLRPVAANDVLDLSATDALPDAAASAAATPSDAAPASIGALVKRIEAYRKSRADGEAQPAGEAPRLPLDEDHVLRVPAEARAFDFATDPSGRIVWADPGVAPMLLGRTLAGPDAAPALAIALRRRQPILAERVALDGAPSIAGDWRVDAAARFDPLTGRFLGHQGRMRRWPHDPWTAPATADSEADRLRQMLHELRTPVNAIQGFSEIIQQQLFGPTPHEYRALAATIVGDAARMLAAFEELERLAKLESAALELDAGETDLAAVLTATVAQLAVHGDPRGSGIDYGGPPRGISVPLARLEVERIAWRLLATLAGTAAPGERLGLTLRPTGGDGWSLACDLPAALAARTDAALYRAEPGAVPQVIAAGVFGVGFALRLVRAELKAAGGGLERDGGQLIATLPGLTMADVGHSEAG